MKRVMYHLTLKLNRASYVAVSVVSALRLQLRIIQIIQLLSVLSVIAAHIR